MRPSKIPMVAVEQLQRTLESAPECRVEEVSKLEAIRMLVPQIRAMQSKGYVVGAIAKMLSENGLSVTGVTLKSYLRQTKAAGGKKSARPRKPPASSNGGPSGGATRAPQPAPAARSATAPSRAAQRQGAVARAERGVPAGGPPGGPPVVAAGTATAVPKATARTVEEDAARRVEVDWPEVDAVFGRIAK